MSAYARWNLPQVKPWLICDIERITIKSDNNLRVLIHGHNHAGMTVVWAPAQGLTIRMHSLMKPYQQQGALDQGYILTRKHKPDTLF